MLKASGGKWLHNVKKPEEKESRQQPPPVCARPKEKCDHLTHHFVNHHLAGVCPGEILFSLSSCPNAQCAEAQCHRRNRRLLPNPGQGQTPEPRQESQTDRPGRWAGKKWKKADAAAGCD